MNHPPPASFCCAVQMPATLFAAILAACTRRSVTTDATMTRYCDRLTCVASVLFSLSFLRLCFYVKNWEEKGENDILVYSTLEFVHPNNNIHISRGKHVWTKSLPSFFFPLLVVPLDDGGRHTSLLKQSDERNIATTNNRAVSVVLSPNAVFWMCKCTTESL